MSSISSIPRTVPWATLGKALGTVFVIFLTAYLTYLGTARSNQEGATVQRRLAAIEQFQESGARLDAAMSNFVDALLDKGNLKDARTEIRTAITLHASHAEGLRDFGVEKNILAYEQSLGQLRFLADQIVDLPSAHAAAQRHLDLMDFRVKLIKQLKHNAQVV